MFYPTIAACLYVQMNEEAMLSVIFIVESSKCCTLSVLITVSWAIQLGMMAAFDIAAPASIYLTSKAKAEGNVIQVNFTRHIALYISDLWMIGLKWINLIRLRTFHLHKRFSYLASLLNYH
ncbi:hypothetical protein T4D_3421 [Trichinella pseudospiralis]|uniref:Uncharacterized protein n=1 Tax=Trichinella pseudospiralis TaxID=6337 RepID=A0A0V1FQ67_TRIPS|nr:hypothetical protein T4D_3421 [Trichinella pseudospiralis]